MPLLLMLLALFGTEPTTQTRAPLTLHVDGTPAVDAGRGIALGVEEMSQTARLLGADVRLVRRPEANAIADGVLIAGKGTRRQRESTPLVHLGPLPAGTGPCSFSVAPAAGGGLAWHPSLDRYGASELNERYMKRYGTGMTADAYAGWIAVKALVESALRSPDRSGRCAALTRLRLDGHKGRPLSFDPATRVLQQPLYVVRDGRAVEVKR